MNRFVTMLICLSTLLATAGLLIADGVTSGIVVYTSMDHGRDEIAFAVPFVKAERHQRLTNVTTQDGRIIRVTNNQLKELVHPTDLSTMSVIDAHGLESLKEESASIRSMQKKYPRAAKTLEPIAGAIERTIQAIESGNVLLRGRLIPRKEYEKQAAAARGKSIDITLGGRSYTGAKLSSINGGDVSIMHSGGGASISIEELSEEQIVKLNETSSRLVIEPKEETAVPLSEVPTEVSDMPQVAKASDPDEPDAMDTDSGAIAVATVEPKPEPEPAPIPTTPISLENLRSILRECEPLLDTVREGIMAGSDLQSFPGGRYGAMKYDEALRESNRQKSRMNAALGAQDTLMERFRNIGTKHIEDPRINDELRERVAKLGRKERSSVEEFPKVLGLSGEISKVLEALDTIAPESKEIADESSSIAQKTVSSPPQQETTQGEVAPPATTPEASRPIIQKTKAFGIPPSVFFFAGLLFLCATAGAFLLQSRRKRIARLSCPRCGTFTGADTSVAGEVLACQTCGHEFSAPANRNRQPSPGPFVYGGVAISSALLLFGVIILIEKSTTNPADLSRYSLSDYPTEVSELRLQSEQGDAEAQYGLARFHQHGMEKFPADPYEAALWFLAAAESGLVGAQMDIGALYAMGQGVEQDAKRAEYWLTKAANNGAFEAQTILAIEYLGKGSLPYLPEKSVYWNTQLAERGDGRAQFGLGVAYREGEGVEKDIEESDRWFQKSAASGYEPAILMVRGRDAQTDHQIDALWRQAAASLPGSSPFSPSSPSTYVPPQYREAERRAYGDVASSPQEEYLNSSVNATPSAPPTRHTRGGPSFFSSSPRQESKTTVEVPSVWTSPGAGFDDRTPQPWGGSTNKPLWDNSFTGEVKSGWTSPGPGFDNRSTQHWGQGDKKPLWDNPFTGEVKSGWTSPGPGFDNRSTQHWGQGDKKPLWINRFTGDVKASWTLPGPGYEKQE